MPSLALFLRFFGEASYATLSFFMSWVQPDTISSAGGLTADETSSPVGRP